LAECLRALDRERQSGYLCEVVVVDDGSTDETVATVRQLQEELAMPLHLLTQENHGPAVARNRGIEAASGGLIVFLGDDIVVAPGYLRHLCAAYESHTKRAGSDGAPHGILGHTRYHPSCIPTPFGQWLDSRSDLQFAYSQAQPDQPLPYALTYMSNVLIPRDILLEVGGFNAGFRYAAYEDTELGYRLAQRNFKLYYCPAAAAVHMHPVRLKAFAARTAMTARALMDLRSLTPELFDTLYPKAEKSFGHPSIPRRIVRWFRSGVLLEVLAVLDTHLSWQLPGFLYQGVMDSTFSSEMTRLWAARMDAGGIDEQAHR
jgi:GT2 family glycosyltransferase